MPSTLRTDVRGGNGSVFGRRHVRTTVVSLLAALVTLLGSPVLSGTAHAASAPADFAGVGDWAWPTTAQSQALGSDGVRSVRVSLAWDWVEHVQGVRQWGGLDKLVSDASANGYELVLVLNGCTAWACGQTRTAPTSEPARSQYQDFVGAAVRRYGAGGAFWAGKPTLAPARINWQVWNEVNVGADWPNPTAAGYAALLADTSATIKAADPSARLVAAGLAELPAVPEGASLSAFLTDLEQLPSFRSSADVVAVHGYAEDPAGTARILDTARRIMLQAGDDRPLWVTELGWGTGGAPHPFVVTPDVQAAYLRQTYDTMVGCSARWHLDRAMWFALTDVTSAQLGEADYWGMNTGLYTSAGAPKPALDAFREFTGGRELPGGRGASCPLVGGNDARASIAAAKRPVVAIVKAPRLVGKATTAKVDFVTDMGNSGRAECSLNGSAWAACSTPYVIAKTGSEGAYQLQIRAIDRFGTTSASPATASWTLDLTPPHTIFTKRPPRRTSSRAVTARLGIQGTRLGIGEDQATFECSLNKSKWRRCSARYRATAKRAGRQVLSVRAVDAAGNIDPRGATAKFTVAARR